MAADGSNAGLAALGMGQAAGSPILQAMKAVSDIDHAVKMLSTIVPTVASIGADFVNTLKQAIPQALADQQFGGSLAGLAPSAGAAAPTGAPTGGGMPAPPPPGM